MRDGDDGARKLAEEVLQPLDRLGVEMVGGLVEQQHVGLLQQDPAQRDATFLAAAEHVTSASSGGRRSASIAISILLSRFQRSSVSMRSCTRACSSSSLVTKSSSIGSAKRRRDLVEAVEQLALIGHRLLDVLAHVLRRVELRLLRQVADLRPLRGPRFALKVLVRRRP